MNLILLEADEIGDDGRVGLSGVRGNHLRAVLKVALGQQVRVGLVDGPFGTGTVQSITDDIVDLRCTFEPGNSDRPAGERPGAPKPRVDLLLALPRPKVMRRLWAQLAAMGVGRIILTNAERVERNYFDAHVLTPEIYRPLLVEGLQQARDTALPEVSLHRRFKVLIEDDLDGLFPAGRRLVADPEGSMPVAAAVRPAERILLAIGPEGGWNTFEIALLEAHDFQPVSMGSRTLRTDTACIALLALVHEALR
jgi:RsmE family RNA methyltransferase